MTTFQVLRAIAAENQKEIIAGVPANFPPQYHIDEKTGTPRGFAIDVMNEVAQRSGIKVRYVVYPTWAKTIEAMEKGEVVLIPNIGIIAERVEQMDFTSPVETSDIVVFIRETTIDIKGVEDLKGKEVAVVEMNKGQSLMQERGGSRLQIYVSQEEAFLSLLSGKSDALVYAETPIKLLLQQIGLEDHIKIVGKPLLEVKRGIAVRKGNHELLKKLDDEVKTFIKTQRYEEIYAKWYGKPAPYWTARRVAVFFGGVLAIAIVTLVVWRYLSVLRLNRELRTALEERKRAEQEIQKLNVELEQRVINRTADLQKKSRELEESQRALMNIVEDLNLKTRDLEQANIKLKELDHLKSMFIASMSHELRTPLNSIIGFSSILLDEWLGYLTAEQKENLAIILRSGKHLLNLINDVIDVSKVEAGIVETRIEDFDIYDVISEVVTAFTKDIKEKGLELKVEIVHQQMHADRRRLLQCVLNLISNAVKFTEKGFVRITARRVKGQVARVKDEEGVALLRDPMTLAPDFIEISVEDTGIGIKEDDLTKLFNAFVRLESPLKAKVSGTGLGLYLTKKLLNEVLKGEIMVESEEGKGSKFTIKVPVRIE